MIWFIRGAALAAIAGQTIACSAPGVDTAEAEAAEAAAVATR